MVKLTEFKGVVPLELIGALCWPTVGGRVGGERLISPKNLNDYDSYIYLDT